MKFSLISAFLVAGLLLTVSCASSEEPTDPEPLPDETQTPGVPDDPQLDSPEDSIITGTGTIQYINLEGGFYGIVVDETNEKYDPGDSLPEDVRIDGLNVQFEVATKENTFTTRMWGTRVEVISIEPLGVEE